MHSNLINRPPVWWRQFWPWFLIALPGSVVVAAIATIYIAVQSNDGLVSENYYKEGLGIHREVAALKKAQDLGIQAAIHIDAQRVWVDLSSHQALPASELQLALRHPTRANQDLLLTLLPSNDGRLYADLPNALEHSWKLQLNAIDAQWQLQGRINLAKSSQVVLGSTEN